MSRESWVNAVATLKRRGGKREEMRVDRVKRVKRGDQRRGGNESEKERRGKEKRGDKRRRTGVG